MARALNLLSAMVLGGCASVAGTTQQGVTASYFTAGSPDATERCLSEQLAFLVGGPAVSPIQGGTRIAFTSGLTTFLVVIVRPEGTGSRIEVRHRFSYPKSVRHHIERCL